jgi:hypothetical protein
MAASKDDARAELDRLAASGIVSGKARRNTTYPPPATVDWSRLCGHCGLWLKVLDELIEREYDGSLDDYPAIAALVGADLGGNAKNAGYLAHCRDSALERELREAAGTQDPIPVGK